MNEFFAMGGYAAYVWPAYGISAVALIVLLGVLFLGERLRPLQWLPVGLA